MKPDTISFPRSVLTGILLLIALAGFAGCEKATLGDGLADGESAGDFHGLGWTEAGRHGQEFMADTVSCDPCHGKALDGGVSEVSCEDCHEGWKGDCTFCHGGMDNDTGAPPLGVRGETARAFPGVGAHSVHVEGAESHVPFSCDVCHGTVVTSYADEGHLDGGETAAEVAFSGPLGIGGRYDRGTARCSQIYCHGDGQTRSGSLDWLSEEPMGCDSCHGDRNNPDGMSGWHGLHLRLNQFGCEACHLPVVDVQGRFRDRALHINRQKDVGLENGSYDENTRTCSTSCHETGVVWSEEYHPVGWDEDTQHGFAFYSDPANCESCHGQALTGGTSGVSCDSCHTGGTSAWRSDCTFCHGGLDNPTGAPPEGVYGETLRALAEVGAHTAHVEETATHTPYDCTTCHNKPAFFDDPNHIDTNNGAEMQFEPLAGTGATYSPTTSRCASLYCHGDGRNPSGQVPWTGDVQMACNSCHGYTSNPGALSGEHDRHIEESIACGVCHSRVMSGSATIVGRALHINGAKNVNITNGGVYNTATRTCSSITCHGSERW